MSETTLRVAPTGTARDAYLPLLDLADDSVDQVLGYYQTRTLFALGLANPSASSSRSTNPTALSD
jgi:hypothetical protein